MDRFEYGARPDRPLPEAKGVYLVGLTDTDRVTIYIVPAPAFRRYENDDLDGVGDRLEETAYAIFDSAVALMTWVGQSGAIVRDEAWGQEY